MPFHRNSIHSNGYSTDGPQSEVGDDMPTYLMEHLATFTVAKETSIIYPADGMRRLLQLEKSNGIWSQKMQLRLDQSWVLIMDNETGAVMERFPASLIQDPTAFTSNDPMEIYNNILVFIVGEDQQDRQSSGSSRSEMHIFQCQSVSAQELVEALKMLKMRKAPPRHRSSHIPPPPATPPPEPPSNGVGVSVREQVSVFNASSHQTDPHAELGSDMFPPREGIVLNDETSSMSSEKYERDVTILNHCFDDIEKFIARLQHAAAASRELERRRRNRKSKKKDLGDGMLTMRAKPPPEVEFIDIFQKFKLSFNLLAKLKAHIHDPNAPELVHFLFTPLALIVDASHDTQYGPNLPVKVVSPLLTREAVNLLINCVTSKETELWHSLGDAWLIPRDQWKGYVPPYHPVFLDGWSPDAPVTDERHHMSSVGAAGPAEPSMRTPQYDVEHYREIEQDDSHYSSDYFDNDHQEPSPSDQNRYAMDGHNYNPHPESYSRDEREHSQSPLSSEREFAPTSLQAPARDAGAHSDISADSIEHNGGEGQQRFERSQGRWLEELRLRGAKVVQVTYPRTANNDKELTVIRGEFLEVVDDSRKWWKARNSRGQVAHVPHTIVTHYQPGSGDPNDMFSNPLYAPPRGFQDSRGELESGSGLDVSRSPRSPTIPPPAPADWVRKERLGKKDSYTSQITPSEDGHPSMLETFKNRNNPPPPPPPPLPTHSSSSSFSASSTISSRSSESQKEEKPALQAQNNNDLMHEELKAVLTMFRNKRSNNFDIVKTPDVYIDQRSNAEEVQQWLKTKRFDKPICKRLTGMTGSELFSLSREQLEQYFGPKDGHRLYGQITIQRNESGFKTARSSELQALLAKARKKAENIGTKNVPQSTNTDDET